jgi:predicted component of type VI protein secretion system
MREAKSMKTRVFALAGAAALALSACSGDNQDAVQNAELNQPEADLNALSSDAANDAANAEAAALGNQLEQLNQEAPAADNTVNPADEDEQNVSGM